MALIDEGRGLRAFVLMISISLRMERLERLGALPEADDSMPEDEWDLTRREVCLEACLVGRLPSPVAPLSSIKPRCSSVATLRVAFNSSDIFR